MGLNLLQKTELWIHNIVLNNANLTSLAQTVARVLGVDSTKVLVVDVRENHITLDILEQDISIENIVGKEKQIISEMAKMEGVETTQDTYVHSAGILGLVCLDPKDAAGLGQKVGSMVEEMKERIARRAIIFPTGFELKAKMIEDTNTPYLKELLEKEGYKVTTGDILEDDIDAMEYKLSDAVSRAYGLIITTGGVGAEDKDKTVESVLKIDPAAATPYIVKFQQGTGRHVKDGVRIAVGAVGPSYLVALPGPHDEVQLASRELLICLKNHCSKEVMAQRMAAVLAEKWLQKKFHHDHDHAGAK